MNANFLKKIFYNRKSRRGFKVSKRPFRRNFFKNNLKRKITYNYNSRVQTYGPNSTVINISGLINWDMSASSTNFTDIVAGIVAHSDEYKKFKTDFEFIKILGIGVTIYPNDSLNNAPTYIDLDWTGAQHDENDITGSDRAKIIYNDLKKQKTFYYRPPDVITADSFNPRRFNLISNFEYSSIVLSVVQDGGDLKGRIDTRVCFRGPVTPTSSMMFKPGVKVDKNKGENKINNEKQKIKKSSSLKNLKKNEDKTKNISNLSFLTGLIEQGISEDEILNSKNFKKLTKGKKNRIKKLLKMKGENKSVSLYLKRKKEKKKENKYKNKIENKNKKINKLDNKKESSEEDSKVEDDKEEEISSDSSFELEEWEKPSSWYLEEIKKNEDLQQLYKLRKNARETVEWKAKQIEYIKDNEDERWKLKDYKAELKKSKIELKAIEDRVKELEEIKKDQKLKNKKDVSN